MQKSAINIIKRVLIVDNDIQIFTLLKKNLGEKGITIDFATEDADAILRAKSFKPEVVITDLNAQINAFEIIKELKRFQNAPDFIVLSEINTDSANIDKGFLNALGIKQFLVKSNYSLEELTGKITKALA